MWGMASLVSLAHHALGLLVCALCNITDNIFGAIVMSVGPSGRIVVEVEPELKRELHSALVKDGQTLKDWFVKRAEEYVRDAQQMKFFDHLPPAKQAQDRAG